MKRVGLNAKRIKHEIAKAANMSVADLDRVFRAVAESDARFAEQWFATDYAPAVKGLPKLSKPIERLLKAQLRITAQAFKNLSQTTIETQRYRKAVDEAISAVQSGVTDYNSAIRRAMKTAAQDGLRVKYPNSGMTRRLDSAIRQNVLDGVRAINNDVLRQLGNEYGADGIEISAHALCATDHLPYQGLQFSNRDFEELQNSLGRPFGAWNCKHTMFPIILGVSVPAHDADELRMYRENSAAEIEIDGRTMSRYEWSKEQRRIETAVRAQKDIAIAAKASGDDVARREAQSKINALQDHYEKVSRAAGLDMQRDRMRVAGFRAVKPFTKSRKNAIIKLPDEKIHRSVGAKNINDDVLDLSTGERFQIVPGSKVTNVEVFAGKGVRIPYRKAYAYAQKYGGNVEDWQHVKGFAIIDYYNEERSAEIHWSRCEGIGNIDRFIKRWLDES